MSPQIRQIRTLFIIATVVLPSLSLANDPTEVLLNRVYASGGQTLYCGAGFSAGDRGIRVDSIYGSHLLLRHFGCITSRQCANKPEYVAVASDLHNLYPMQRSVEIDRRGSQFGDLPPDSRENDCGYRIAFQTFEPPEHAKGNVARAMLYMHRHHNLPLVGTLEMYQRWHRLDPPDPAERARNEAIGRIQGNRNPFIDNPDLVDRLSNIGNIGR
jgi:deoxyribonuclease I